LGQDGGGMTTQKDSELAQSQLRIREAIERFKSYISAGKIEDVRRALATKNISASTMRNWTKDTKKLWTSYRRTEFADAIGTLPDLDREKRNQAYEFALKELGVGIEGQRDLESYHGNYRLFHNFTDIELNNFVVTVEHSPFVVTFALKYLNRDRRRGKCDGLIISRHGRLVCAGFSPTTVFQSVFRCVGYPQKELIRGMAFIEDLNTQEVCFSTIVIARDPNSATSSEAAKIVRNSGRSL
jgi:hypothetical protein